MCKASPLGELTRAEALAAVAHDLTSGKSTYASMGAVELLKALGVELTVGCQSIDWVDMPLAEAEDGESYVHLLESKVSPARWAELRGLLDRYASGEQAWSAKDFSDAEWDLMEADYNLQMQSCIECDRIYDHALLVSNGVALRFRFVVSWVSGEVISAQSPYDFRDRR